MQYTRAMKSCLQQRHFMISNPMPKVTTLLQNPKATLHILPARLQPFASQYMFTRHSGINWRNQMNSSGYPLSQIKYKPLTLNLDSSAAHKMNVLFPYNPLKSPNTYTSFLEVVISVVVSIKDRLQ